SRRRHTRSLRDWSSDVCSSDLLGYLKTPRDGVYSREVAEYFRRSDWPQPLTVSEAQTLEQALLALADAEDGTSAKPVREFIARPEDVVLDIPPDVNPKLVDAFL